MHWSRQGLLLNLCSVAHVAVLIWLLEQRRGPEASFEHPPLFLGALTRLCGCHGPPGLTPFRVSAVASLCSLNLSRPVGTLRGPRTVACSFAFVWKLSFNERDLFLERERERETKQDNTWAVPSSRWLDENPGEWNGGQNGRWVRWPSVSSACWLALSKGTIGA